jgi:hypothetical protein
MVADPTPTPSDAAPAAATRVATGPRTPAGKARSSMNALAHGLTAKTPLLPGEDAGEFRRLVWGVVEDLAPVGPVQTELAHRAAVLMWRLRRVNDAEEQAFYVLYCDYEEDAKDRLAQTEEFAETPEDFAELEEQRREEAELGEDRNRRALLADELALTPKKTVVAEHPGSLERLAGYEQRIARQLDSTIRLLLKLQNRKESGNAARGRAAGEAGSQPLAEEPPAAEPSRAAAPRRAPSDAADPAEAPPPAPAQNELPPTTDRPQESTSRGDWTGPPGLN